MPAVSQLDRYRLMRPLGSGGMARVMLAEDTLLGRKVALKQLNPAGDPRGLLRLRREALIGASVSHRNLVSIYDVIEDDEGDQVIVMEYVDGETLRDALRREGRLAPPRTLMVVQGVAAALDAIHRQGIVHRDVKPPNVLLGADGSVKLADLGIAAAVDRTRITTDGAVLGTFSYMAPEQLSGHEATPASDVYALGAMTFEMLAGRKARTAENPLALAHQLTTEPPPDLRESWPQAPAPLAALLTRSMARDPAERPKSAGELARRLKAGLDLEPTARARPAVRAEPIAGPAAVPIDGAEPIAGAAAVPIATGEPTVARRPDRARAAAHRAQPPVASRSRWFVAAALAAVIVAIVLAATLSSGSGSPPSSRQRRSSSHLASTKSHAASTRSGAGSTHSGTASHSSSTRTSASSPASTPAPSGSTSASSGSSSTASGTAASGTAGSASSPSNAVQSFYHLAAAHDYSAAWALADSALRNQLRGYSSFEGTFSSVRAIDFSSASVVKQTSSGAAVAVRTTSVQDSGTQQCSGAVDLVPGSSGSWLLHYLNINCAPVQR